MRHEVGIFLYLKRQKDLKSDQQYVLHHHEDHRDDRDKKCHRDEVQKYIFVGVLMTRKKKMMISLKHLFSEEKEWEKVEQNL